MYNIDYTNDHEIPLSMAVWLLHDEYDHIHDPKYFSVTTLMKPVRQIILAARAKGMMKTKDLSECIASALGSTIHAGVEKAWTNRNFEKPLRRMGHSEEEIAAVRVNPTDEELEDRNILPIYVEQRSFKNVAGFKIGGKFDLVVFGQVQDTKSTSVYTYLLGGKDADYILQGSLYRWLNPDKITKDSIQINFLFTDWKKSDAKTNPDYPKCRIATSTYKLIPVPEVEIWVRNKLAMIAKYWDTPEEDIPHCTEEELWMTDPSFRYYSNPATAAAGGRSTKNFTNLSEAMAHQQAAGKGVVIPAPRTAKRCSFCDGFAVCTQKDSLNHD